MKFDNLYRKGCSSSVHRTETVTTGALQLVSNTLFRTLLIAPLGVLLCSCDKVRVSLFFDVITQCWNQKAGLQPLDLACGTLFRSSCAIQTSAMGCLDDSWRDICLVNHERGALWLLDMWRLRKTLTYLLINSFFKCSSQYYTTIGTSAHNVLKLVIDTCSGRTPDNEHHGVDLVGDHATPGCDN